MSKIETCFCRRFLCKLYEFWFCWLKTSSAFDITTCPFEVNKQIMQLHYLFHYRIASEQVSQIKLINLEIFNYCLASDHSPEFKKLLFMIHKLELERILWAFPGKKSFLRVCFAIRMSQSILHEPQDPGTIWLILYL